MKLQNLKFHIYKAKYICIGANKCFCFNLKMWVKYFVNVVWISVDRSRVIRTVMAAVWQQVLAQDARYNAYRAPNNPQFSTNLA